MSDLSRGRRYIAEMMWQSSKRVLWWWGEQLTCVTDNVLINKRSSNKAKLPKWHRQWKKKMRKDCRAFERSKHRKPGRWERFPVCCVGQREGNTWRFAAHSSNINKPLLRTTRNSLKTMFSCSEQVTCRRILTGRNLTRALRIAHSTTEARVSRERNVSKKCAGFIQSQSDSLDVCPAVFSLPSHLLTCGDGLSAYWNTCSAFPRAA